MKRPLWLVLLAAWLLLANPADVFRVLNVFSLDDVRRLYGLASVVPPAQSDGGAVTVWNAYSPLIVLKCVAPPAAKSKHAGSVKHVLDPTAEARRGLRPGGPQRPQDGQNIVGLDLVNWAVAQRGGVFPERHLPLVAVFLVAPFGLLGGDDFVG